MRSEYCAEKRRDRGTKFASREPVLGYYLIVTDTEETEKNYFEGLKKSVPSEIRERIVIWMYAYFGEMPSFTDSLICCSRFAARFEEATGRVYQKNDVDIYKRLMQYGNFDIAYRLAEQRIAQAEADRKKPSESYPACTLAALAYKYLNAIVTMRNAFYIYGLTDAIPDKYDLATNRNAAKIPDKRVKQYFYPTDFFRDGADITDYKGYRVPIYCLERMLIELMRYKKKLPFDYYKEIILNYRKILPRLNIERIQDFALAAPKSNKILETLQMEVL